jgi:hypothetical protein
MYDGDLCSRKKGEPGLSLIGTCKNIGKEGHEWQK